jgi:hypothetical protein
MASLRHILLDLVKGLPAVSPLSVALAARRPGRMHLMLADVRRLYRMYAGLRLPSIAPWELLEFEDRFQLTFGENDVFAALEESFLIAQLVAIQRPERIFEIGTSQGRTTALMAMNTPETTRIFTLDLPPEMAVPKGATDLHLVELARKELGIAFRETNWAPRITQLLGDSRTFDFSPYYDSIDFATVDGSHSYPFVFSDSMQAFRMIRPGGVILWHDYESMRSEYGVTRFVDGLRYRHGLPSYRLGRPLGAARYGVISVTGDIKQKVMSLAENPERF